MRISRSGVTSRPHPSGIGPLVAFRVGVLNTVLADPVVETVAEQRACCEGKVDEELVGLELVDQVKATLECVLRSPEVLPRVLVKPLGQCGRPPPRE